MANKRLQYFHTIRARILLSTILLIVMISTIITLISYFVVSTTLEKNMIQTSETRLSFLGSSIESNINNITTFIRFCRTSSKIKSFAIEENTDNNTAKREARDFIIESSTANSFLRSHLIRLVIMGKSRNDIIQIVESPHSSVSVSVESITSLPYFSTLYENQGKIVTGILMDPFITTRDVPMIPMVHTIPHPYTVGEIGYIFTEMSAAVITSPIQNYLSRTNNKFYIQMEEYTYTYDGTSLIPYEDEFRIVNDLSDKALSRDTKVQRALGTEQKGSFIMITRPLSIEGWYITESLDETILSRNIIKTFLLITLIILIASSIICLLLSLYLSKTVNVPVKQLQKRMKRIATGDFERSPETEWEHELGDIGKHINDLSENVKHLMDQRLEDERQKRDYEYKMLQSQINPHFLYNTLNSIKWMATIQNAPGIAEMTTALSRLLKEISKGSTNLVTLEHEISLINDYFTIQQYRYGGTITLNYHIEDDFLTNCNILKFTLQPIVENAIFHGIGPKGSTGTITIHIYQDENQDVHIDITDDGVGMEPETAANLLNKEISGDSSFFKGIGMTNVHKRLQYEFGEKYGLSISSTLGEFTTISVLLPFR